MCSVSAPIYIYIYIHAVQGKCSQLAFRWIEPIVLWLNYVKFVNTNTSPNLRYCISVWSPHLELHKGELAAIVRHDLLDEVKPVEQTVPKIDNGRDARAGHLL